MSDINNTNSPIEPAPLPPAEHGKRLTEQRNPKSQNIDRLSTHEALALMQAEDRHCFEAAEKCAPQIEEAIGLVVEAFERVGRLIYVGAGTSGRLGVLDASEQPPTFGVPLTMVQGFIAGGDTALRRSIEGAEDRPEDGAALMGELEVGSADVVMGIASGGRTPYVLGALAEGRRRGAATIFLSCTPALAGEHDFADVQIHALVGPEIVTGSTRLKAGTVTKLILNQITTISMIRIGKVYENLMVDLRPVNAKLVDRACRILGELTGVEWAEAHRLLKTAGMELKVALVMAQGACKAEVACRMLSDAKGHVATAVDLARGNQG